MKSSGSLSQGRQVVMLTIGLIVLLLAFSIFVVKEFQHPLVGEGDWDYWEYTGFYLRQNLRFTPWPQLNLITNKSFYPYGVNAVFQPWGIERDYFYAIFSKLLGQGPWVQIYYLISIAITNVGTFMLLRGDYGPRRSLLAGFFVTAAAFYSVGKYPIHAGYAIVHWTVLSFIVDFLLVKKFTHRSPISLQLILVRLLLLVLCLGQELGYVAGLAMVSLTVSGLFILVLALVRWGKKQITIASTRRQIKTWQQAIRRQPRRYGILVALVLAVAYLYVPLVIQISVAAKSFRFSPEGTMATSPWRLLVPFFPSIDPSQSFWDDWLKDQPEGVGAGSPGYFLLILGMLGLWQARRRWLMFVPLLLMLFAGIFYDPTYFPTLKVFPWFAFARIGGRVTIMYPVILSLLALHVQFADRRPAFRAIAMIIVTVACVELLTFYQWRVDSYQPYPFPVGFQQYMARIKAQPGEALLDFPFCAIGGNSTGQREGLCPYYGRTHANFSFRRFHGKKVMGQYFGRLHPDQIAPLIAAGWPKMFFPDSADIFTSMRQTRCFNAKEWQFFEDFYRLNDFAGINLYVERFPKRCVGEFYQRFGPPVQQIIFPLAGKVVFIPKPVAQRDFVNLEKGLKLKLE
jgi:hypothetical protein